jgi:NADH:ubiquinone oxidoreductase subunit 5 (subunit L)/multisubunit Na+/H+ antiporter MnhA subunit
MRRKFYFDEIYSGLVVPLHDVVAAAFSLADRWLLNGLAVRGLHGTFELAGRALRLVQSGNLQTYSFLFAAGLAVVAWFFLR